MQSKLTQHLIGYTYASAISWKATTTQKLTLSTKLKCEVVTQLRCELRENICWGTTLTNLQLGGAPF